MENEFYTMGVMLLVALYCALQAARDFRNRRFGRAAAGLAALLAILLVPISTHAVKIDLPAPASR